VLTHKPRQALRARNCKLSGMLYGLRALLFFA
jgi:hypothetical protein